MAESVTPYPVTLQIDYPDREMKRLSTFFRCIFLILELWGLKQRLPE